MLNEHDLQEFYEHQLREQQEVYRKAEKTKAALIEEQIQLWQRLIKNHKKLWGIK